MRTLDEIAYDLLKKQIEEHYKERCRCDLTPGGYGFCLAGQWLEGCISSEEVVELLGKNLNYKDEK